MKTADIPNNEQQRLDLLEHLKILDTELEASYDEVTALAADICDVPICAVSLIDKNRQWFKSRFGLEATETPRDFSFCAHTILADDVFEIPNSFEDERFKDNPLVTGEPRVVFYAGHPVKATDDVNLGALCVIDNKPRNLTELQKKALTVLARQVSNQLMLRKALKDLESANLRVSEENSFKTKFFASVSHEIRTSLNGVIGLMDVMKQTNLDDEQSEMVTLASKAGFNLLHILNDILDLSKIEAGRVSIRKESLLIRESVQEVVKLFEPEYLKKGLWLKMNVAEDVPTTMQGDETRLKQVIINYISNALKFTDDGGVTVDVMVKEKGGVPLLRVDVTDTGEGIDEVHLQKLFNVYEQAESKVKNASGAGLGLFICKRLADLMGGTVSARSVLGEGSTFSLEVPL